MGAKLWRDVCQINKVNHTDADLQQRLQNQPVFGGSAPPGKCLICDDVVICNLHCAKRNGTVKLSVRPNRAEELANLRQQRQGGRVSS